MQLEKFQQLAKQQNIESISNRQERWEYLGLLSEYQLQPEIILEKLKYTKLNPQQHFLFKRVLHGLNVYTPEEVEKLHWDKKRRIKKVWQRGQTEINNWKQIIAAKKANLIFSIFEKSNLCKKLLSIPVEEINPEYINKTPLKDLGIDYDDVILFYMSKGLLPRNFLTITQTKKETLESI